LRIFKLIQKGNHQNNLKISGETTISLGLNCILQIVPIWAPCECWQRCRWTKLFGWNV